MSLILSHTLDWSYLELGLDLLMSPQLVIGQVVSRDSPSKRRDHITR